MGKIVIHAGMPKTGSSSIQEWLRDRYSWLREECGVTALRAKVHESGEVRLVLNEDGKLMNAGKVRALYEESPEEARRVAADFLTRLDRKARAHGTVVLSAERYADWFWQRDASFAGELDGLASEHEVSVAYYVRPQHTALEAAWRQWGFRGEESPSAFLAGRARQLDYLETLRFMREAAPRVEFLPRPFRRDLLAEGNVVIDFARNLLGVKVVEVDESVMWRNRGLPLELVNVLHGAPEGLFWPSPAPEDVNPVLERLREFASGLELPPSEEEIGLSRLVLQQVCHERFEPANLELIAELGWPAREWVPAVEEPIGEASFERLDELWRPRATEAELALLRTAIAEMLALEGSLAEDAAPA